MKLCVVTAVWGERYVDFFLRHIAPTIRRNLPAGSITCVATTQPHEKAFAASRLSKFDVVVVADKETDCKYARSTHLFTSAMQHVIRTADTNRFVIQPPDCYVSPAAMSRAATTKKKVMTAPAIRVCQRTFLERHKTIGADFSKQWMDCLHPLTLSLATSGGGHQFNAGWPSVVYEIGRSTIKGRSFHRHPIMVEIPADYGWPDTGTVDNRLVESLGYAWEDFDNLTDSDQGCIVELCDEAPPVLAWCATSEAAAAIERFKSGPGVTDMHRKFYEVPYTWHA